jgi:hypothetical protein
MEKKTLVSTSFSVATSLLNSSSVEKKERWREDGAKIKATHMWTQTALFNNSPLALSHKLSSAITTRIFTS